jgi:transposase
MLTRGRWSARERRRAQLLLLADAEPTLANGPLAARVDGSREAVRVVRSRYLTGGLDAALFDRPRSGQPKKTSPDEEAFIIATACSDDVPAGAGHWTLAILVDRLNRHRKRQGKRPVGVNPVRRVLLTHELKPWREKNVGHPEGHTRV